MTDDLKFEHFVRTPFAVEATQITNENIHEISKLVGRRVGERDGVKYIEINRQIVRNVGRAYVGWWLSTLEGNLRCYAPEVFEAQYMAMPSTREVTFKFDEDVERPPILVEPRSMEIDSPGEVILGGKIVTP